MNPLSLSAAVTFLAAGLLAALALVGLLRARGLDWPGRVGRVLARPWTGREAWLLVAVQAGLLGFALRVQLLLARLQRPAAAGMVTPLMLVAQSVLFDWAGLAAIVVLLRRRRWSWRQAFGLEARGLARQVGRGVWFYLAAMPFFWFYSTLYQLGLKWLGVHTSLQEVAVAITTVESLGVRLYLLALAVAIAPVFEELFFRGILLPALARRVGAGGAVILTSLVFAAFHVHLPSFLPLFLIAVAFALAYLYTGSLLVPMVMHGVFNAVNLILLTCLRDSL